MSSRFEITNTPLAGLQRVQRKPISDSRGYFERLFCADELKELTAGQPIIQINHSRTHAAGTVRGLHFQHPPHSETKLINCLRGEIFDVAVDLRPESPTYLQWHAEILSEQNHTMLVIPEGFAHGFQTLTNDCELLYLHTKAYHPEAEAGIHPLDHKLRILWPLPPTELSPRDANLPVISSHHPTKRVLGQPPG